MKAINIPVILEHALSGAVEHRTAVGLDAYTRTIDVEWGTAGIIEFSLKSGKPMRQRKLPWRLSSGDCEKLNRMAAGLDPTTASR